MGQKGDQPATPFLLIDSEQVWGPPKPPASACRGDHCPPAPDDWFTESFTPLSWDSTRAGRPLRLPPSCAPRGSFSWVPVTLLMVLSIFGGHTPCCRWPLSLCGRSPAPGMRRDDHSCTRPSLGHVSVTSVGVLVHCAVAPIPTLQKRQPRAAAARGASGVRAWATMDFTAVFAALLGDTTVGEAFGGPLRLKGGPASVTGFLVGAPLAPRLFVSSARVFLHVCLSSKRADQTPVPTSTEIRGCPCSMGTSGQPRLRALNSTCEGPTVRPFASGRHRCLLSPLKRTSGRATSKPHPPESAADRASGTQAATRCPGCHWCSLCLDGTSNPLDVLNVPPPRVSASPAAVLGRPPDLPE